MRADDLEYWILSIVDEVEAGRRVEDWRVEIKAEWPMGDDRIKTTARRLAGHANAARGDQILWIIGLDEKSGIVDPGEIEVHQWLGQLSRCFESEIPHLEKDIRVKCEGGSVVGLLFDTDRAPYVVKNPVYGTKGAGPVEREVPYRTATEVRSACHADLIRILVPRRRLPQMDVFECRVHCRIEESSGRSGRLRMRLFMEIYVIPVDDDERVVIPFHNCGVWLADSDASREGWQIECDDVVLRSPRARQAGRGSRRHRVIQVSPTIRATPNEVFIDGPGMMVLEADATVDLNRSSFRFPAWLFVRCELEPVGTDESIWIEEKVQLVTASADTLRADYDLA